MRIRKHAVASSGRSAEEEERKEFLQPLVAAVATAEGEIAVNALTKCTSHTHASQVVRDEQKANHRWNEITSANRGKKRLVPRSEGISVKKQKESSKISKLYGKQELKNSGQFEVEETSMRRGQEQNLREKEKNNDHGRKDDSFGGTRESTHKYKCKIKKDNTMKKKNENEEVGSQCRRRNGRGWRCSERTLVGYSLCEHHRGNARFKSLSGSNGADKVSVNNYTR